MVVLRTSVFAIFGSHLELWIKIQSYKCHKNCKRWCPGGRAGRQREKFVRAVSQKP